MKIENQVCLLEQAKRLKELGVAQTGLFTYNQHSYKIAGAAEDGFWSVLMKRTSDSFYSAFTVAELGVMLPDYLPNTGNLEIGKAGTDHFNINRTVNKWWYNVSYWTWETKETRSGDIYLSRKDLHLQQKDTLAQAMGEMLIFLLENNLITAEEVNERLCK
jgi:hypothetical protein